MSEPTRAPALSVIIPCYNAEPYLAEAIESVLAQTRPASEIIVVDDCSTDGSAAVARRYPVVLLTQPENAGNGAARNRGLDHATGELIAFLDADDYWAAHHLETLERLLAVHADADVAFTRVQLFGDYDNRWWESIPPDRSCDALWECIQRVITQPSGSMVRSRVTQAIRFDGCMRCGVDFDFWLRVSRSHRFVCSSDVTAYYRKYPAQISRRYEMCKREEFSARQRFWRAEAESGSPEYMVALGAAMRRAWEWHLQMAWDMRDFERLRFYLTLAEFVPESGRLHRVWSRRLAARPGLQVWDRRPAPMRDFIKRRLSTGRVPG
jgi:glycosyltransferase involved in cell wall biosynthesis